jgi:hypothetical protein
MFLSVPLQACVDASTHCRNVCKETLFQHCFDMGGKHTEKKHVNLMIDCIEICQLAGNLLMRGSESATDVCRTCADICDDCANSCESLRDEKMDQCAEACRDCADVCRSMTSMPAGERPENVITA